jgi:hypothetical protein
MIPLLSLLRIHNTARQSVLLQKRRSSYFSRNKPSLPPVTAQVWQAGLIMPEGLRPPLGIRISQISANCQAAIVAATFYLQPYFAVVVVVDPEAN